MNTDETRYFGRERREGSFYAPKPLSLMLASAGRARIWRLALGIIQRLSAGLAVAAFCWLAWFDWWTAWYLRNKYDPPRSLGPVYFLVNASPADDWIGYAWLSVVVPFVVWPRRWTAWPVWLLALGWVFWSYGDWLERPREHQGTTPGLIVLSIAAGVTLVWHRRLRMTLANFERVQVGMSLTEALDILGPPSDYATRRSADPFPPSFAKPGQFYWRTDEGLFEVEVVGLAAAGVVTRKEFRPAHPPQSDRLRYLLWQTWWWLRTWTR